MSDIEVLRNKARELRTIVRNPGMASIETPPILVLANDIAVIADLLADHLEFHTTIVHQRRPPFGGPDMPNEDELEGALLTTVTVQHDASFNESPISEWTAGDARLADCSFRWDNEVADHTHACVKGGTHGGEHVCECGQRHRGLVIPKWHAGDPPGPGEPGDASDAT